ncbi:MAG: 16S rRNA (guanine(966)-N(2))-methyltransferase RsmD [Acidimicrobiales bacterium]|jgi:16S rRNA (guanine966-N2)-methyltransferase
MRVIGGKAKRRQLRVPDIAGLRPTSDRVREAIFDILASRGAIEGASVLDAFAGSGALGIEALSRGAASVCFVEADRRAVAAIHANLASTGFATSPAVRVVRADVPELLAREAAAHYDLALVDPPYSFDDWPLLLGLLKADLAVLETSGSVALSPSFAVRREYRYGGTLVTLVEALGRGRAEAQTTEKDTA